MAQRKVDRFAQMSKQEEIIAKKRKEILEKQRTAELAKKVAAAMQKSKDSNGESHENTTEEERPIPEAVKSAEIPGTTHQREQRGSVTGKIGKISFLKRTMATPAVEQPPAKVQNSFCNDGSFLDHFKKILEKQEKPKIVELPVPVPVEPETTTETEITESVETENIETQLQIPVHPICSQAPPPVSVPAPTAFAFAPTFLPQGMLLTQQQSNLSNEQPPSMPATFFGAHFANFTPPPPPPPQLPLSLASLAPLYMIPAPDPLQLSAIQAPKELDLNAIPKPQVNIESNTEQYAVQSALPQQVVLEAPQQQQQQQPHVQTIQPATSQEDQQTTNDNDFSSIQLPTTIENLIALVADCGDEYEDFVIRTQKNRLHPAMWFLFDKQCPQYHQYRQQLNSEIFRRQQTQMQTESQSQSQSQPESQLPSETQLDQSEATNGDEITPTQNSNDAEKYDPETAFGGDIDSDEEYMQQMHDRNLEQMQQRIDEQNEAESSFSDREEKRKKQRRSRWGEKVSDTESVPTTSAAGTENTFPSFGNQNKPKLTGITRSDPGLLQYARLNYGSTNLSEEDWMKCEEHYKVNLLYQDMMRKRQEIDRLARSGKFKYEYDSDEDVDGGTWEHKLRNAEMEATHAWANALTKQSEGKHHIGDFLPPEELKKFMEQYEAKKNNRQPDLSDYKEYKLREDNIGFQMLQKLGWKEGQGLGTDGAGIVDPVNKGPQRDGNQGLGVSSTITPEECDNQYDAYRKRMMLAYRFRPNPLNNPRRAYY